MTAKADSLLLFGATGDLSQRMLLPSLCALHADGLLDPALQITGTARSPMDDHGFRNFAREALEKFMPAGRRGSMADFLNRLHYQPLDVTDPESFAKLGEKVGAPDSLAIFLSTAPNLFEPTIRGLENAGLARAGARISLEKPLGTDLASSCEINDAVASVFPESRIFRIDHYLGKETVQNLLALRFANIMFEPLWNAQHIEHVQITVGETVGLEKRADFYDQTGALRDMVQNHMLQLLALVAMEPPSDFEAGAVRDEKVKVLRALRPIGPGESVTEIVVQFRKVPHSIFTGARTKANRLLIGIQPEENITLSLMAKVPGLDRDGIALREVPLDIRDPNVFSGKVRHIAYERLLLDLLEGDQKLFVRRDEVEAQWAWVDAIRAQWAEEGLTPKPYAAGS